MTNSTRAPNGAPKLTRPRRPDSLAAEAAFRARLAQLGATLIEPAWLGAQVKHRVVCREGHACSPKPASVQQGQGICRACAGQDPVTSEAAFRARLAVLGAEMLGAYAGSKTRVRVRCAAGHICHPRPETVQQGGGICAACAGNDPVSCEKNFRVRLAGLGAVPLYTTWHGANRPHEVRCAAGHACRPRPSDVLQGHGICLICAGKSAQSAEAAFRELLAGMEATLLEPAWLGVGAPHRIRCRRGHIGSPTPTNVLRGAGACYLCAHNGDWDAFYVVTSSDVVKFGITTGRPEHRLRAHARDGIREVVRLATGLPESVALDTERAVRSTLALAGEKPVRGREYFGISCLALILDVADSWLEQPPPADSPAREILSVTGEWTQGELFAA